MAEALIKYETIDETQIKDIMEGARRSRPPIGTTRLARRTAKRPEGESEGRQPIGTPAGQH